MEYNSIDGSNHIIQPIGYMQARKTVKPRARTRSAREQFDIHMIAAEFTSELIYVPKPIRLESNRSYTMEMFLRGEWILPPLFSGIPRLMDEIVRFKNFMYLRGYFAAGFSIHRMLVDAYMLVDVSGFGQIQNNMVKFPRNPRIYTIYESELAFGLLGMIAITPPFVQKHSDWRAASYEESNKHFDQLMDECNSRQITVKEELDEDAKEDRLLDLESAFYQ